MVYGPNQGAASKPSTWRARSKRPCLRGPPDFGRSKILAWRRELLDGGHVVVVVVVVVVFLFTLYIFVYIVFNVVVFHVSFFFPRVLT